jgi:hypothetical protein
MGFEKNWTATMTLSPPASAAEMAKISQFLTDNIPWEDTDEPPTKKTKYAFEHFGDAYGLRDLLQKLAAEGRDCQNMRWEDERNGGCSAYECQDIIPLIKICSNLGIKLNGTVEGRGFLYAFPPCECGYDCDCDYYGGKHFIVDNHIRLEHTTGQEVFASATSPDSPDASDDEEAPDPAHALPQVAANLGTLPTVVILPPPLANPYGDPEFESAHRDLDHRPPQAVTATRWVCRSCQAKNKLKRTICNNCNAVPGGPM